MMFNAGGAGGFLFWYTAILKKSFCREPIYEIAMTGKSQTGDEN